MTVLNILNMAVVGYILVKAELGPFVPLVPDFTMIVACIPVVVLWETGRYVLMGIIVIELALSLVMVATGRYWVAVGGWLALLLSAAIVAYLIFFVPDGTGFLVTPDGVTSRV